MFKKILLGIATFVAMIGVAFADVDVNKGDQAALDNVKGIGPVIAKRIIDERQAHGPYKDWADFENRVKGIGDKKAVTLSQGGLTVNGQPLPNTTAAATVPNKRPTSSSNTSASGTGNASSRSQPTEKGGAGVNSPFTPSAGTATSKSTAPVAAPVR